MALAKEEREMAAMGEGCLGKSADDEPVFILCGRDALAPDRIDDWANEAEKSWVRPEKVAEARECAEKMRQWRIANRG